VDDVRLGQAFRAARIKRRLRQTDLARLAHVSVGFVRRIERGDIDGLRVASLRRVAQTLGMRLFIRPWLPAGDLDRLLNARHSALHESVAREFATRHDWRLLSEVSFNLNGERGVIDLLAYHAPTRSLLVIELKTEIVDIGEMLGTLDRKRRLAFKVAAERGLNAVTVSVWLIVAEGSTNRRRVAAHRQLLRSAFPSDGRSVRGWLGQPRQPVAVLSFWARPAARQLTSARRVKAHGGCSARR
jgi:transcriptional regulator with XRE-family HTH domain